MHKSHYINGNWYEGQVATRFNSYEPGTQTIIWSGSAATETEVQQAVSAAQAAFPYWSRQSVEARAQYLAAFVELLKKREPDLATLISQETGKPLWEASTEVAAMIAKFAITMEAYTQRTGIQERALAEGKAITRHAPHGVLVVLGPYNFPGHLPNGHIMPALLAGNTIVFKPSEWTPAVAAFVTTCWHDAQLPAGVLNLVQGDATTARLLVAQPAIAGVLFTGSYATGKAVHQQFAGQPEKILALEMGGNNPLVITDVIDLKAAAYLTIQSAFITAGQRCTCARRLIVMNDAKGDDVLQQLITMTRSIQVDHYTAQPEPFMGSVISSAAAQRLLEVQQQLVKQGAVSLLEMQSHKSNSAYLTPGIVEVTNVPARPDEEYFGPLLQVIRVKSFDEAIAEANRTRYGLAAGILTDDEKRFQHFYSNARAGIVNWNRPLTGASSHAPFGGIGYSGNHRPSAFYAADYCAFPVASMQHTRVQLPSSLLPGITL